MDTITKLVGARIRGFRKEKRLSQEELAEKNPTIESVMKVADGLEIPIDQLFINIPCSNRQAMDYIPDRIMYLVAEMSPKEQRIIYDLLNGRRRASFCILISKVEIIICLCFI